MEPKVIRNLAAMRAVNLRDAAPQQRERAAEILVEAMKLFPSAWKDMDSARAEVATFLGGDRLALLAIEGSQGAGQVAGWIGAIRHSVHLWELHPLAVHPDEQGAGVGAFLIRALEEEARAAGVSTMWLGADDDFGGTNLFGEDLYPNVLDRLRQLAPLKSHPCWFYQRLGYTVVGVLPDATGPGKHDILMAKRITP
ncbi:MAG TPA: GNAT family N-acetyltransferase [Candidatus Acidoferrales bacterium]